MKLGRTSVPITPFDFSSLLEVPASRSTNVIPTDARSRPIEDFLEFHVTAPEPVRTFACVHCPEPPTALVCPDCSSRQPFPNGMRWTVSTGTTWNACSYCGVTFHIHGTRLFWWR